MKTTDKTAKEICKKAYPEYKGRKFFVEILPTPETSINVSSYWDEGTRDYFVFIQLKDNQPISIQVPAQSAYDKKISGLENVVLPRGVVCVRHSYFCGREGGCTIIARPDDMNPNLLK